MPLQGYTEIQAASTAAGSAITSTLADGLRTNDFLFEKVAQALLASPFVPNGMDGDPTDAEIDAKKFINARNLVVGTDKPLTSGVPLIWFARERMVINARIDAKGKGAPAGQSGDFGGAGGGAGGGNCIMPFGTDILVQNGASAETIVPSEAWRINRALLYLPHLKGGAGGGGGATAGSGGGVVCLCAPIIEFSASGIIDASGNDGTAGAGGGGGGLIILITNQILPLTFNVAPPKVLVNGGSGSPSGGNGRILKLEFQ